MVRVTLSELRKHSEARIPEEVLPTLDQQSVFEAAFTICSHVAEQDYGIRVLRWNGYSTPDIPQELRRQIIGRRYDYGITVDYRGQKWVVLSFDATCHEIARGEIIPESVEFDDLHIARLRDVEIDLRNESF